MRAHSIGRKEDMLRGRECYFAEVLHALRGSVSVPQPAPTVASVAFTAAAHNQQLAELSINWLPQ